MEQISILNYKLMLKNGMYMVLHNNEVDNVPL